MVGLGISLTDKRNGTALFTSSDMLPGDSESKCILVTYEGSTPPDAVRLYVADVTGTDSVSGTGELTGELDVSIRSDADSDGATDCSTFDSTDEVQAATALSTMPTGYAGGVELDPAASTDWTPDDGESRASRSPSASLSMPRSTSRATVPVRRSPGRRRSPDQVPQPDGGASRTPMLSH